MSILSPVTLINALVTRKGYAVERDIAYGGEPRHRLDVYAPTGGAGPKPVVVFLYGGGWEAGSKNYYLFVGAALASKGIVAVVPDYRIYPEVRFPGFVEDAARAVRWTRDRVAGFGGDPARLVVMGHSAGAHIAAMLSFDRQWLAAAGIDPYHGLRGMIGLAGPYDFLPLRSRTLKTIFGPSHRVAASQPINFVDGTAPPALLATARRDRTVEPGNTFRLAERIRREGGRVEVEVYDRAGHQTIIGAFAAPLRFLAPVLRDTADFVEAVTRDSRPEPVAAPRQEFA